MIGKVLSACTLGVDAFPVDVEVRTKRGSPHFIIVGLGGAAIRESRERVLSALINSGFSPPECILVNLAPAEIKKEGAAFDLAIALGVLMAEEILPSAQLEDVYVLGELSLDGGIKPVRGVTARAIEAYRMGARLLIVPKENYKEAKIVRGLRVEGVSSLLELLSGLHDGFPVSNEPESTFITHEPQRSLNQVIGQESAKRALTIAAAGRHNLLMLGPPGCGKSMLAERLPGLLPKLLDDERLEVCKIQSLLSYSLDQTLAGERPFRAPHHTISDVGLFGGSQYLRPGEITLAHKGVLFLDEFPEFKRSVLEALRTPLETRRVVISRATGSVTFPADFQLVAAMNPCPCGGLGGAEGACRCSQASIASYVSRLSQPILDRIDLHVELSPVSLAELSQTGTQMTPDKHRENIINAEEFKNQSQRKEVNARVDIDLIKISVTDQAMRLLISAGSKLFLSARGATRVLRVARTIADLELSEKVDVQHVAEALSFRKLERITRYIGGAGFTRGSSNQRAGV